MFVISVLDFISIVPVLRVAIKLSDKEIFRAPTITLLYILPKIIPQQKVHISETFIFICF